ncbi:sensor histidine kinase [Clostridium sp. LP20]|uniref:sensor histidine kinase n=1 Tax=Clostridium sp. LP20 TaxID=3418665 RepID=UPI003EE8147A
MPFMTIVETLAIVLFRNIIFQRKVLEDFDIMIPVSIFLYGLNKYVLIKVPTISFIVILFITILFLNIKRKNKIWNCITEVIVGLIIMIVSENIALGIALSLQGTVDMEFNILNIICIFISYGIVTVILLLVPSKKYEDFIRAMDKNNTFILLLFNLVLVTLIAKLLFDNDSLRGIIGIQILVIVIIFAVLTFWTYCCLIHQVKERDRLLTENSFKTILEDYVNQLRANEHEYKNHLNAIYSMILVNDDNEVRNKVEDYIGKIKQSDNLNKLLYVNNIVLKAVLYSKIHEAEDRGIKVDYEILSSLEDIEMNSTELVVVISNLLNNAIEAANDQNDSWIKIDIYEKINKEKISHYIAVENSVEDISAVDISSIMNKGYTTKANGNGYGLYNISKVMKRVSGNIIIEPKKDSLRIELEF